MLSHPVDMTGKPIMHACENIQPLPLLHVSCSCLTRENMGLEARTQSLAVKLSAMVIFGVKERSSNICQAAAAAEVLS